MKWQTHFADSDCSQNLRTTNEMVNERIRIVRLNSISLADLSESAIWAKWNLHTKEMNIYLLALSACDCAFYYFWFLWTPNGICMFVFKALPFDIRSDTNDQLITVVRAANHATWMILFLAHSSESKRQITMNVERLWIYQTHRRSKYKSNFQFSKEWKFCISCMFL